MCDGWKVNLVNFDLQTQTTADFYVNVITGPIALIFWKNHCVAIKKNKLHSL